MKRAVLMKDLLTRCMHYRSQHSEGRLSTREDQFAFINEVINAQSVIVKKKEQQATTEI